MGKFKVRQAKCAMEVTPSIMIERLGSTNQRNQILEDLIVDLVVR